MLYRPKTLVNPADPDPVKSPLLFFHAFAKLPCVHRTMDSQLTSVNRKKNHTGQWLQTIVLLLFVPRADCTQLAGWWIRSFAARLEQYGHRGH